MNRVLYQGVPHVHYWTRSGRHELSRCDTGQLVYVDESTKLERLPNTSRPLVPSSVPFHRRPHSFLVELRNIRDQIATLARTAKVRTKRGATAGGTAQPKRVGTSKKAKLAQGMEQLLAMSLGVIPQKKG